MKYLTIEKNGELYQVALVEERFFDKFKVYAYNPKALIFKRTKLDEVEYTIACELATKKGIDKTADDFLINVAKLLVDNVITDIEKQNEEEALRQRQLKCFNEAI